MTDAQLKTDNAELRSSARIEHSSPIQIKDVQSGNLHKAKMLNFSREGLYFESDSMLNSGMKIYLGIKNSPYATLPDVLEYRRGEIQWRKRLKQSFYQFGYGVKLSAGAKTKTNTQARSPDSKCAPQDQRRHPRKACQQSARLSLDEASFEGEIQNVSLSGIFISSERELTVDQILALSVPGKDGKELKMRGKVVWCSHQGCGIKIQRIEKILAAD
jgi:Tfp pilus assembly protein PilZ